MHINVRDLLAESIGYNRAYHIAHERPQLKAVSLVDDITGDFTLTRLETGLMLNGKVSTQIQLDCDRCLCTFSRPITVTLSQLFSERPRDDDMPIVDRTIDLAPMIEQEIILNLPIKILHAPDCSGIQDAADKYTKEDDATAPTTSLTKGS